MSTHLSKHVTATGGSSFSFDANHRAGNSLAPKSSPSSTFMTSSGSAIIPSQQHPPSNAGYQAQQPWMHAYHPQYAYSVPFVHGYAPFPMPTVPPGSQQSIDTSANGMGVGTHAYWHPIPPPMFKVCSSAQITYADTKTNSTPSRWYLTCPALLYRLVTNRVRLETLTMPRHRLPCSLLASFKESTAL